MTPDFMKPVRLFALWNPEWSSQANEAKKEGRLHFYIPPGFRAISYGDALDRLLARR